MNSDYEFVNETLKIWEKNLSNEIIQIIVEYYSYNPNPCMCCGMDMGSGSINRQLCGKTYCMNELYE